MADFMPHQAPACAATADQTATKPATGIGAAGVGKAEGTVGPFERRACKADIEGDDA